VRIKSLIRLVDEPKSCAISAQFISFEVLNRISLNFFTRIKGKHMTLLPARLQMINMEARVAGPVLMFLAAFMFTIMSVLVKLMPQDYTIWHLGFIRCFGGMMALLISAGFPGQGPRSNPFSGHNIPLLILRGCVGSIAFFCVVTSLRILPISTACVLFYSYPVFAGLFGFIIYRETINIRQMGCVTLLAAGIAVLFDFNFTGNTYGQIMAIIGALFAGLTVTLIRSLRAKNGPVIIYLYFCTMGTLLTLPAFIMNPIHPASALEWAMILGLVCTSLAAQLIMNQGFFFCKGWEGSVYMSSETIFTAIVGVMFLNDPTTWRFFAGALLIVGSGLALSKLGQEAFSKS
jgi:drug/metabolite transporter (DMT)-like permease